LDLIAMNQIFGRLSFSARLILAAVSLCALGVGSVALVLGWQAGERTNVAADQLAARAAGSVAAEVAGELGASFSAVEALAAAMEGMRVARRPPSRDQLDDMARQQLRLRSEFIGTYSIWATGGRALMAGFICSRPLPCSRAPPGGSCSCLIPPQWLPRRHASSS